MNLDDFQVVKADLLKAFKPSEVDFLKKNWFSKETFVCRSSTQYLSNPGVHSTQQAESINTVLKKSLLEQDPELGKGSRGASIPTILN
ncbi:MAG: hypothetical protein M1839_002132 [Geoglossum umbratile]|nr:MAG: hypothetical protein M1839_002132 [Geoglossum umbratile]